ncbi:uncharacterized protein FIBRA_02232 [Fibroporia radiculosa]|uniref:Alpha/beta hydrolase fold-3 domain-containing protein n=1 Tax=Fibroporia radiculosa TaxID=599839 RepID=J4H1Q9_9APHY|nr:uncharacterized protein FIBRA_02232 [Fibroporia radiculosa]CCM00204.1 predicted protein [Fibroporia radiculosa]
MKFRTKEIIDPNYPLLDVDRAANISVKRTTHVYGETDVHKLSSIKLDVYHFPIPSTDGRTHHILVFFYGGGFTKGSRLGQSPPHDLVHANLGAFFARRGILTVVPDYHFVPSITYPQGSEDVRDALLWVVRHLHTAGDASRVFVLAHSAGGVHAVSMLLLSSLFSCPFAPLSVGCASSASHLRSATAPPPHFSKLQWDTTAA